MDKIIYHSGSDKNSTSVFDEAIVAAAKGGHLKMVSPYIGMSYLKRLVELSSNWRLLTDIGAWMLSIGLEERAKAIHFIKCNHIAVHHCDLLHAKAVIGEHSAYFGSANLTERGILGRTEIGFFTSKNELVLELNKWFDGIWDQTDIVDINELTDLSKWLDANYREGKVNDSPKITSINERIKSKLTSLSPNNIPHSRIPAISAGNPVRGAWISNEEKLLEDPSKKSKSEGHKSPPVNSALRAEVTDTRTLDILYSQVLKLVIEYGNPLPLYSPWSVLQEISRKTRISWIQVSKTLASPQGSQESIIEIKQRTAGCQINLDPIRNGQLMLMPRTTELLEKL